MGLLINYVGVIVTSYKLFDLIELQSFTKYLRQTLVFMWNGAQAKSIISIFQEIFASIKKIYILAGRLGTRISFYEV